MPSHRLGEAHGLTEVLLRIVGKLLAELEERTIVERLQALETLAATSGDLLELGEEHQSSSAFASSRQIHGQPGERLSRKILP